MKHHVNRSASNSSMLMAITSTSLRGHTSSSGGASGVNQNRRRQSSATTANVDIEVPAAIMTGSGKVARILG